MLHQAADGGIVQSQDEIPFQVTRHIPIGNFCRALADHDLGREKKLTSSAHARVCCPQPTASIVKFWVRRSAITFQNCRCSFRPAAGGRAIDLAKNAKLVRRREFSPAQLVHKFRHAAGDAVTLSLARRAIPTAIKDLNRDHTAVRLAKPGISASPRSDGNR